MILKQIALEQRPRERMKEKGVEAISDSELLVIIIDGSAATGLIGTVIGYIFGHIYSDRKK